MKNLQFRALYREFLFRMIDLEILSPQGDIGKLLGQFAGILIMISGIVGLGALFYDARKVTAAAFLVDTWFFAYFLIKTTMLVVGLFAVLAWDSMFLDRRDVMVLGPLPVRPRTLFLAKVAAVGSSLSLTVAAFHSVTGIAYPLLLLSPSHCSIFGLIRSMLAYWIVMMAAGAFIFCLVLFVQGLAAQLPRRLFLRVSGLLQIGAFSLLVVGYCLEPSLANPAALAAPANQATLAWLPSYWFLGLFEALNGTMNSVMVPLANHAVVILPLAIAGAAVAFLLSYFRTLRKIVEEPDIVSNARRGSWLPRFGNALQTAIVHFGIRTLMRSRQHRVILAFYLGLGVAVVTLAAQALRESKRFTGGFVLAHIVNVPVLMASLLLTCAWIAGTRVVFSLPLELRANWIFRVTAVRRASEILSASRRALLVMAVLPVLTGSAILLLPMWPWPQAVGHLVVVAMLGIILTDLCLLGFRKIPFTCSYLPGKSRINMVFLGAYGLALAAAYAAIHELPALFRWPAYLQMVGGLLIVAIAVHLAGNAMAKEEEADVQFEDLEPATIISLQIR